MYVQNQMNMGQIIGRLQNQAAPAMIASVVVTLLWAAFGFDGFDFTAVLGVLLIVGALLSAWVRVAILSAEYRTSAAHWSQFVGRIEAVASSISRRFTVPARGKKAKELRDQLVLRVAAIAHVVRGELRGIHAMDDVMGLLTAEEFEHVRGAPDHFHRLVAAMAGDVQQAVSEGRMSTASEEAIAAMVDALVEHRGRCVRQESTVLPATLLSGVPTLVSIIVVLLPLCLVTTLGWLTPIGIAFLCILIVFPIVLGNELSSPYGAHPDCLPLYRDCRDLERTVKRMIGNENLPPIAEAYGGVIR